MTGRVDGFVIPLHRSLTQPMLLGGAPRTLAIANGTMAAALGLGLQMWVPGLVIGLIGHTLAVFAARYDPDFVPVLLRHLRQKAFYAC
jgi:type IV secretion system protein VirB3